MQDIEFTIQEGQLWMLQCRIGKRTGLAALQMALDMVDEKMIDEKTAVMRVSPAQLDEILHPILNPTSEKKATVLAMGLPASPGGAVGQIVFNSADAMAAAAEGMKAILIREETSPEDIEGMRAAEGILTTRGGMTSHAALVARGWGKCCIVGCEAMHIDLAKKTVRFGDKVLKEGDWLSLNGSKGLVYADKLDTMDASQNPMFIKFMNIVDKYRRLGVRTNADTPEDAEKALKFGAEGIGLFRVEHMFYGANSEMPLMKLRKMILCDTDDERRAALAELEPYIKAAVKSTMKIMDGKPVVFILVSLLLFLDTAYTKHIGIGQQEMIDIIHGTIDTVLEELYFMRSLFPPLVWQQPVSRSRFPVLGSGNEPKRFGGSNQGYYIQQRLLPAGR